MSFNIKHFVFPKVPLDESEQFDVEAGDCLGFTNYEDFSVLGHHFEVVDVYFSENITDISHGQVRGFELLQLPNNFALGAGYGPSKLIATAQVS